MLFWLWRSVGYADSLLDGVAEEVFDLTVDAAEFTLGPGFNPGPELRVDTQQK